MTKDDTDVVSGLRHALAVKVGPERFDLWFNTTTHFRVEDERLMVSVPSAFIQDWLRTRFRPQIEEACHEILGRQLAVSFHINPALGQVAASSAATTTAAPLVKQLLPGAREPQRLPEGQGDSPPTTTRLLAARRRRFARLDELVVGSSNRLAYVSALEAVERLGQVSPLLIHGPTGTGKTHLLEGIWSHAKQYRPGINAVYLTAEQFTTCFLEALHGSGLPNFRRKYRGVELLLIDDLQFFAGKKATANELLYTIDALLRDGRQLVFASDRPAAQLHMLGPALRTRLQGGLTCNVEAPDFETRLGIVRHVAGRMNLALPLDVQQYVARQFVSNARELIGAVNRLQVTARAMQKNIDRTMAEQALGEMLAQQSRTVRLADVQRAVCEVYGLAAASLQADTKNKQVTQARMLAMWLARRYTSSALSEIGSYFGGRSHSTVISAARRVDGWMQPLAESASHRGKVEEAIRRIEQNTLGMAG